MKQSATIYFVLFLIGITICPEQLSAQNKPPIEQIMRANIQKLKDGVLLVRLQTREQSITALRQNGQEADAKQLETNQAIYNREIIKAFRSGFDYCPVLFFFSNYSDQVLTGNTDVVIFLNDSLQPDQSIKLEGRGFLIAEFGVLQQDTAVFFQDNYYYYGAEGREEQRSVSGGADQKLPALRIMDERFLQLAYPFPYYARTYQDPPSVKKINKAVVKMNTLLKEYYAFSK